MVAVWYLPVRPLAHEVYAEASNDCWLVLQAHGGQVQAVRRHEVRRLRDLLTRVDDVTEFHDKRVRMLDGYVEAERHKQHVLVADQLLRLLGV